MSPILFSTTEKTENTEGFLGMNIHFLTTNRTNFTNLAWVDACGAGQNPQNYTEFCLG
jgi:hypothetical protein